MKFKEYLNEKQSIKFKKSKNEDRTTIEAWIDGVKAGSGVIDIAFQVYDYEFYDMMSEDDFWEKFDDDTFVKFEHLEVADEFKGKGIGSAIIEQLIKEAKKTKIKVWYLNASPMGYKGLKLKDLTKFYKKFGFKTFLNQGGNEIMIKYN